MDFCVSLFVCLFPELHLSSNHLSSLPDELRQVSGLTSLDISHNDFDAMPQVVYRLEALRKLNAEKNEIKGQLLFSAVCKGGKFLLWWDGIFHP